MLGKTRTQASTHENGRGKDQQPRGERSMRPDGRRNYQRGFSTAFPVEKSSHQYGRYKSYGHRSNKMQTLITLLKGIME